MLASTARNSAYYRERMVSNYRPDPSILRRLREYDPAIDLRWNGQKSEWALWIRTSEGDVFCRHLGPRLTHDVVEDVRLGDWSRNNAVEEFMTLEAQSKAEHRARTHDLGDINDKMWHGASCDDDWTARHRKNDILKSEGLND